MERNYGTLRTGLFLTGTVIGAGFASGKELWSFFGKYSWLGIVLSLLCGALFTLGFIMFMHIGKRLKPKKVEDINAALLGKYSIIGDVLILLNFTIGMAAMLSASTSLFEVGTGLKTAVPWFALFTAAVVFACVMTGLRGVMKINIIVMPLLIGFLCLMALMSVIASGNIEFSAPTGSLSGLWAALTYVSMNFMQSFAVMCSAGTLTQKKEIKRGSILAAVLLSLIMILVLLGISAGGSGAASSDMPLIYLSRRYGSVAAYAAATAIWAALTISLLSSVFTLSEWLNSFIACKWLSIVVVLAIGLVISMLGFSFIVSVFFPLQGALGLIYIAFAARYYIKGKPLNSCAAKHVSQKTSQSHTSARQASKV